MQRVNIYLKESHLQFLKELNELSASEHIRRALDQYIDKLQPVKASASLSKKKGGDK